VISEFARIKLGFRAVVKFHELLSSPLNKICVCLSVDKLHIKSFPTNLLLSRGLLVKQSVVRSRTSLSRSVICNVNNNISVVTRSEC